MLLPKEVESPLDDFAIQNDSLHRLTTSGVYRSNRSTLKPVGGPDDTYPPVSDTSRSAVP